VILTEEEYKSYFESQSKTALELPSAAITTYILSNVQSGGYIPTIYFGIIDIYGQIVQTDTSSLLDFK